jgi:uncharacterized membrane protein YgaE (UPF0421/DUF939 family)
MSKIVIFELAKLQQIAWKRMMQVETQANDAARLFCNLGGQLLLEEKDMNYIDKMLPKVERELTEHIKLYEEQNKTPFKIYEESAIEFTNNQKALHKENQEQERKAKGHLEVLNQEGTCSCVLHITSLHLHCLGPE